MKGNIRMMIVLARVFFCVLVLIRASSEQSEREAEKKCKEYVKFACDNPIPSDPTSTLSPTLQKTENGDIVSLGRLPHVAYINTTKKYNSTFLVEQSCTGALISEYYVMTAVRCGEDAISDQLTRIYGKVKLGSVTKLNDGTGQWFNIIQMVTHPNYSSFDNAQHRYNILLLKLDRKVEFSPYIRPICLNTKLSYNLSEITAPSGWGMNNSKSLSGNLTSIKSYVNDEKVKSVCSSILGTRWSTFTNGTVICAGNPSEMKAGAVVRVDAGAPFHIPLNSGCPNTYEQIGISISQIELPDADPESVDISTNIAIHIPWIEHIVWEMPSELE